MKIIKNKKRIKFYYVNRSIFMVGEFSVCLGIKVCAMEPAQAINRYLHKKKEFSYDNYYRYRTEKKWATFRVIPFEKPHERFALYFKE